MDTEITEKDKYLSKCKENYIHINNSYYLLLSSAENMKPVEMFILCDSQGTVLIRVKWETVNYCEV